MKRRMYKIKIINERTGLHYESGFAPDTHEACCVLMRKMTAYSWRRLVLEEVQP